MYNNIDQIKANVKTVWYHPNCKFQRGDRVVVNRHVLPSKWVGLDGETKVGTSHVSAVKQRRVQRVGHVVAVSCTPDGRIRGKALHGWTNRMFTRYYVQFADGLIGGFESHHLDMEYTSDYKIRDGVRHDLATRPALPSKR